MRKLLLGLGTLASIVAPITTVVACGTTSDSITEGPSTPDNGNQNPGTDSSETQTSTPDTTQGTIDPSEAKTVTPDSGQVTTDSFETQTANSITVVQVESLIHVGPDSTKLPSQVTGLPTTVNVIPTTDPSAIVIVNLAWNKNDYDGLLKWEGTITGRTNSVPLTGTISGFKLIKNSFEGTFSTPEKQKQFLAIRDTIVTNTFDDEKHLTSLSLPKIKTIEYVAFHNSPLTSLSLSEVTSIGDGAFYNSPLTSLSFPKVTSIGDNAFYYALLTSLSLPEATSIGDGAFQSSHLTSLSLPKATSIGDGAFHTSPLTSLSLPKVITISDNAFTYSPLTSLSLSEVTSIGKYAFYYALLTSLSFPKATSIGDGAFSSSPLTSLSLPKATSIGVDAFSKIVNDASTVVTLQSVFNTDEKKNKIFGAGNWDKIHFTWVDDEGKVVGETVNNVFTART